MEEKNVQMVNVDANSIVDGIRDTSSLVYSSFSGNDKKSKIKLYNAINGDGGRIKEAINKKLEVVDVVIIPAEVVNEDGTRSVVPRCTLVLKDGTCMNSTSWGVYKALQKVMAVFGDLHFAEDDPLIVIPAEIKTKNGFTVTLRMV